jgi:hypothetical protein
LVLSSLLGLGAKFGRRAELRSFAMEQAQSLLAQHLVTVSSTSEAGELTGELKGPPSLSYRIDVVPFSPGQGSSTQSTGTSTAGSSTQSPMQLITVRIFESPEAPSGEEAKALAVLSQLVRSSRMSVSTGRDSSQQNATGSSSATDSDAGGFLSR